MGSGSLDLLNSTPPCIFSAGMVATRTIAAGFRFPARHLRSKNFSPPSRRRIQPLSRHSPPWPRPCPSPGSSCSRGRYWRTGPHGPTSARLGRLDQVRQHCLIEYRRHRPSHADVLGTHGVTFGHIAHKYPVQASSQVGWRVGQTKNGHNLAGCRDIETGLARDPL